MTITLRVILIVLSIANFIFIIRKIKQSKLKIEDSVMWIIASFLLIFMSIFAKIVEWLSIKMGFMAPVNFVFVAVNCFLIYVAFTQTLKVSLLNEKIKNLNHFVVLEKKGDTTIRGEKIEKESVL